MRVYTPSIYPPDGRHLSGTIESCRFRMCFSVLFDFRVLVDHVAQEAPRRHHRTPKAAVGHLTNLFLQKRISK